MDFETFDLQFVQLTKQVENGTVLSGYLTGYDKIIFTGTLLDTISALDRSDYNGLGDVAYLYVDGSNFQAGFFDDLVFFACTAQYGNYIFADGANLTDLVVDTTHAEAGIYLLFSFDRTEKGILEGYDIRNYKNVIELADYLPTLKGKRKRYFVGLEYVKY
jgi:hypothetical protein